MAQQEADNIWMVCINCESTFSCEDLFFEEEESDIECPVCSGHTFRKSDDLGFLAEDFHQNFDW